jgi:hypothetical protein
MKRMDLKNKRGITLVALVITIIVLLILAGITISLTIGEGGIITLAQQAGKNYVAVETAELEDLNNLIPLASQITADNYGDYVNYPVNIGSGPDETAHKTDWRIFYKDDEGYVYLIASYVLLNSEVPEETTMIGFTPRDEKGYTEERPYATYWGSNLPTYKEISTDVATRYKFNFRYKYNGYRSMSCISELLDTAKWTRFVDTKYALDAVGAPTLEMWVASWNEKGYTNIYYDNASMMGYYIGKESLANKTTEELSDCNNIIVSPDERDKLYFSGFTSSWGYWLASPCPEYYGHYIYCLKNNTGIVANVYRDGNPAVRPVVCLKANITATQDENGVWQLHEMN